MPSILLLTCIGSHIKDSVTRFIDRFSSLQNKHIRDLITYSLCSPEALEEVIKLKLSCDSLDLYITNEIAFVIKFDEENHLSLEPGFLILPGVFRGREEWTHLWKMPRFSIRDVLNHFTRMFSKIRIKSLQVHCEMTQFDLNLVKHELRGVQFERLVIGLPQNIGHVRAAMNMLPYPDMLGIYTEQAIKDDGYLKKLTIRNFEAINALPCDFDAILMFNASWIHINVSHWKDKELNRLLKLWIKGSIKNLENLLLTNDNGWNLEAVLKGIAMSKTSGYLTFKREDGEVMIVSIDKMPNLIKFDVRRRGSRR